MDKRIKKCEGVLRCVVKVFWMFGWIMVLCGWAGARSLTIDDVVFDGSRVVSEDVLRKGLLMRSGMPLDSALVVGDMKRILLHYQRVGYWQARVHFPEVVTKGNRVILRFRIEEHSRTQVESLDVMGDSVFAAKERDANLTMPVGTVLTAGRLNAQMETLLQFYENRGYPFCALKPGVIFVEDNARVVVDVQLGPLCVVDTVAFEGNALTRADVLLREMRLIMGEVYDQRKVDRAMRYLRRLRFLNFVDEPDVRREGDVTTLVIRVQEARTARVEGSVGYAGEGRGVTGAFALDIHNVAGAGRLGQVAWQRTGEGASDLQIRLEEPWMLNRPFSAHFELDMRERLGYSEWGVGIGATVRAWEGRTVWGQVSRGRVVPDSLGFGVYEPSKRWAMTVGGAFDVRDDVWNPRHGWVGDTSLELSRVAVGGISVVRRLQTAHVEVFFPMGERSVWALSGQGQWVSQGGGVPNEARIRVGGARSIRGYREEAFLATEVGWGALEWRYLIGARSRLFGFVDAGILRDITGRVVPIGYGVGMVLQSKMGMVGFDVGWARADGFGDGKVHVRVVNSF
jgi:outer membrane protein insertion porin family